MTLFKVRVVSVSYGGPLKAGVSGGVRVIYYYHNETIPLFLLTIFGKGEKANLSKSERNELAKFTSLLIKQYGG